MNLAKKTVKAIIGLNPWKNCEAFFLGNGRTFSGVLFVYELVFYVRNQNLVTHCKNLAISVSNEENPLTIGRLIF